jgi:hypothetical protein
MKRKIYPTVAHESVNNNYINDDWTLKITVKPSVFVEKGKSKIIREADIKTPKELIAAIKENTAELENDEIIRIAKKIIKSGNDTVKAFNNEANINFCKQVILSLPINSYTYYSYMHDELIPYLKKGGIKDRAITIALRELLDEGFLEEVEFYHYSRKVKGYKVIGVEEF